MSSRVLVIAVSMSECWACNVSSRSRTSAYSSTAYGLPAPSSLKRRLRAARRPGLGRSANSRLSSQATNGRRPYRAALPCRRPRTRLPRRFLARTPDASWSTRMPSAPIVASSTSSCSRVCSSCSRASIDCISAPRLVCSASRRRSRAATALRSAATSRSRSSEPAARRPSSTTEAAVERCSTAASSLLRRVWSEASSDERAATSSMSPSRSRALASSMNGRSRRDDGFLSDAHGCQPILSSTSQLVAPADQLQPAHAPIGRAVTLGQPFSLGAKSVDISHQLRDQGICRLRRRP